MPQLQLRTLGGDSVQKGTQFKASLSYITVQGHPRLQESLSQKPTINQSIRKLFPNPMSSMNLPHTSGSWEAMCLDLLGSRKNPCIYAPITMTKFQVVDNHQIPENGVQRLDLQEVAGSWVCLYEWNRLVHGWIPRLMDHQ